VASRTQWMTCAAAGCGGQQPHTVVTTSHPDGRVTRAAVCGKCRESQPFGICCASCGDARFKVTTVRHVAGGCTIRFKKCRHCGLQVRTRESVASNSA